MSLHISVLPTAYFITGLSVIAPYVKMIVTNSCRIVVVFIVILVPFIKRITISDKFIIIAHSSIEVVVVIHHDFHYTVVGGECVVARPQAGDICVAQYDVLVEHC